MAPSEALLVLAAKVALRTGRPPGILRGRWRAAGRYSDRKNYKNQIFALYVLYMEHKVLL